MKAKREQINDKLIVIKLFAGNYARDLLTTALIHMYKVVNMIKGDESFVSSKIKENLRYF